jgi:hypothetical protein
LRRMLTNKGVGYIWSGVLVICVSWMTRAVAQGTANTADPTATADYFAQMAQANVNMTTSVGSLGGGGALSGANIFAGILFGAIGLGAFIYGKKNALWRPMALGVALMALPYFPLGNGAVYLIGAGLSAALVFWR